MAKRRKIPQRVKDHVRTRQKNGCATCIDIGNRFHHVLSSSEGGFNSPTNIVLLCEKCHDKIHLGDLAKIMQVVEYVYYIKKQELPSSNEEIMEMAETIKKEHKLDDDLM